MPVRRNVRPWALSFYGNRGARRREKKESRRPARCSTSGLEGKVRRSKRDWHKRKRWPARGRGSRGSASTTSKPGARRRGSGGKSTMSGEGKMLLIGEP